jgi:hypothetical protein
MVETESEPDVGLTSSAAGLNPYTEARCAIPAVSGRRMCVRASPKTRVEHPVCSSRATYTNRPRNVSQNVYYRELIYQVSILHVFNVTYSMQCDYFTTLYTSYS